jgi:hypothetical protein
MKIMHSCLPGINDEHYCLTAAAIAKKAIRIAAVSGLHEVTVCRAAVHRAVYLVLFSLSAENKFIRIAIRANNTDGFVLINPTYFKNYKIR